MVRGRDVDPAAFDGNRTIRLQRDFPDWSSVADAPRRDNAGLEHDEHMLALDDRRRCRAGSNVHLPSNRGWQRLHRRGLRSRGLRSRSLRSWSLRGRDLREDEKNSGAKHVHVL